MAQTLPEGHTPSSPTFRRIVLAMLGAGLATFNAMYCTQALLPVLSDELRVSPATASLTISAATGILALTIIPASILSERFGRKPVILASTLAATILGLALPIAPNIHWLIVLRALQGLALAGVPATAMTYLSEEVHPAHVSRVMGLYVAGTSVGGLTGRLVPSLLLEVVNWRWALAGTVVMAIVFACLTCLALPDQRRFRPKELHVRSELRAMRDHWRNPRLAALYCLAFLFMGVFVSLYNYMGYRLTSTFGLSEGWAGAIFLLYLSGTYSATHTTRLLARYGRPRVLGGIIAAQVAGLSLLYFANLGVFLVGALIFTAGFFAAHAIASGWVGVTATSNRAEASSMYLFTYYMGSSMMGWASGVIFHALGWWALVVWLTAAAVVSGVVVVFIAGKERQVH